MHAWIRESNTEQFPHEWCSRLVWSPDGATCRSHSHGVSAWGKRRADQSCGWQCIIDASAHPLPAHQHDVHELIEPTEHAGNLAIRIQRDCDRTAHAMLEGARKGMRMLGHQLRCVSKIIGGNITHSRASCP